MFKKKKKMWAQNTLLEGNHMKWLWPEVVKLTETI